jgi:hypothetical protein
MEQDSAGQVAFPFPKSRRIKDPQLLAAFRTFPCLACGVQPSEAHHITTRGAGGDDVPQNLMPLCTYHHHEWHLRGPAVMVSSYPRVRGWLEHWDRHDILARAEKSKKR